MKPFILMLSKVKQLTKVGLQGSLVILDSLRPSHQHHFTIKLQYFIKLCYLKSWVWMDFFFKVFMS